MPRPRQKRNDPRTNLTFYGEHLQFCQAMAWQKHQSVTAFVNGLIAQEMAKHDREEWDNTAQHKEGNAL